MKLELQNYLEYLENSIENIENVMEDILCEDSEILYFSVYLDQF